MSGDFDYTFTDELTTRARYWTNPDGSKGGIVSVNALIEPSAVIEKRRGIS